MKIVLGIASVIALSVAPVLAGEGRVSDQSLANMGLAGMQTMTDAQGTHVRGLAIAVVGGFSSAGIGGVGGAAGSTNFYFAAGKHSASGNNASIAGDATSTIVTLGSHSASLTTVNVIGAGGFSSAKAH
jgi:hypothetical protein